MWQKYQGWFIGLLSVLFVVMIGCFAIVGGSADKQHAQSESAEQRSPKQVLSEETKVPKPVIEEKTVTETQPVPFDSKTVNDSALEKGKTMIKTAGVAGVRTITYQVTYTDSIETSRTQVSDVVTTEPVTQVMAIGTKVASKPKCDPNYSGACVPIASDVDCAGGTGNGPAYVSGPVYVIGSDIYDLDRDGNGVACQ